ncbi:MAG: DNA repair protein RecN [Spirochaetia bacterium]|nr:DNA repair protein RecN [Spirochaetia bacterium]
MLEDLTIKDFALIDSDYLEFNKGFTVFSGETGAGKSILIGALSFLLGGKAETSMIRHGKNEASVSGTFYIPDYKENVHIDDDAEPGNVSEWLVQHNVEVENNRVLLRRYIRDTGKSAAWINDVPVTRTDLAQFSSFLVDIHGQHEHQSLMKVSEHRKFLDARCGIVDEVHEFTQLYASLVEKRKSLSEYSMSEDERQRKLELMSFAVQEISEAKLKKDEDTILEEEETRLLSYEKLYSNVENLNNLLSGKDENIVVSLKKAVREAAALSQLDKSVEKLNSRLESAFYELSDLADEFSDYQNKLVFDPNRLQEVEDRLSLIYNLKKKYASSVNAPLCEVMNYFQEAQKFVEENTNGNDQKSALQAEIKVLEKEILSRAAIISDKRKKCASELSSEVNEILGSLGMKGTQFVVGITEKSVSDVEQKCGPYGKDNIEFLISANPGNPPQPLAKIASGGELSRVMLALKTIFAEVDKVDTLIFDEIDTGIGGEVAVAVGNHIKKLSEKHQIFCITHLASIAVYADNQIKIEKSVSGEITSSNVYVIEGEQRVSEIARMLSGDSDNAQSLEHARSMLNKFSGGL